MHQLKRANIITLKKLRCNDARSYQRSVNRVADGSRLVPKQFDDEIPWSPVVDWIESGYCSLVNPSMKSKLDFNQNSKAVDFDQVHGCIFPKKYPACRASSLLISPHYSSAEADPYLPCLLYTSPSPRD